MEIKNIQESYRCFKSVCIWSLLSDLIVLLSFALSFSVVFLYSEWGSVGWIVPVIVKLFFIFCLAIANGYLAVILFLEAKGNKDNLPLLLVNKTEILFNNIVKNNVIKNIIIFTSIFSYIINIWISIINFYTIFVGLISFGIILLINKRNKN